MKTSKMSAINYLMKIKPNKFKKAKTFQNGKWEWNLYEKVRVFNYGKQEFERMWRKV